MSTPPDLPATANGLPWDRADSLGHALARRHAWPGTVGHGPRQIEPGRLGMADIAARHLAFASGTLGFAMRRSAAGRDALTVVVARPLRRRGGAFGEPDDGVLAEFDPADPGTSDPPGASNGTAGGTAAGLSARSGSPAAAGPGGAASRSSENAEVDPGADGEVPDPSPSLSPIETAPEPAHVALAISSPAEVADLPVSNPRPAPEAARHTALPPSGDAAPAASTRLPGPAVLSPARPADPAPGPMAPFSPGERPSSAAPPTVALRRADPERRAGSAAFASVTNAASTGVTVPTPWTGAPLPPRAPLPVAPVLAHGTPPREPAPTLSADPPPGRLAPASLPHPSPRTTPPRAADSASTPPTEAAVPMIRLSRRPEAATHLVPGTGATPLPVEPEITHRGPADPAHPAPPSIDPHMAAAGADAALPSTAPWRRSDAPAASSSSAIDAPAASSSSAIDAPAASPLSAFVVPVAASSSAFGAPAVSSSSTFGASTASSLPTVARPAASSLPILAAPAASSRSIGAAPSAPSSSIDREAASAAATAGPSPSQVWHGALDGASFSSFSLPVLPSSQRPPDARDEAHPADPSQARPPNRSPAVGSESTPVAALPAGSDRLVPRAAASAIAMRPPRRGAETAPPDLVAAAGRRPAPPPGGSRAVSTADAATTEPARSRHPAAGHDALRRGADTAAREPVPTIALFPSLSDEPVSSGGAPPLPTRVVASARAIAAPAEAREPDPPTHARRAPIDRADAPAFDPFDLVAALPAPPTRDPRTARDTLHRSAVAMAPVAPGSAGSPNASGAVRDSERDHGVISVVSEAASSAATPRAARPEPPVDVEDIVERAVEALLLKLDIERERRGFARWA